MILIHRLRSLLRWSFRRSRAEVELNEEIQDFIERSAAEKVDSGMSLEEAERIARIELGGVAQVKEVVRATGAPAWLNGLGLDIRLGFRMLRKSWGLTLVGGLAMVLTIAISATLFTVFSLFWEGDLPLEEGDRVVRMELLDGLTRKPVTQAGDVMRWRKEIRSVLDISAFRTVERDLITEDGSSGRATIAEMTSSGFRVARVQPLLGRPLFEEDERDDAEAVIVIAYDLWQALFSGDPSAVGQTVRLGGVDHLVVGVMPEDFAFPVNHQGWMPFRADPEEAVDVFGRLAADVELERARAELALLGPAPTEASADLADRRLIRVKRWGDFIEGDGGRSLLVRATVPLLIALLLLPPCVNVAILFYARNLTRREEFAARHVLGAGRVRIVGQLFVEALVLTALSGAIVLLLARLFLGPVQGLLEELIDPPYWIRLDLTFESVLYVTGLVVFAAMISGGLPALRATVQRQTGFHALGSRTRLRLGKTWVALIAAQVAVSMAILPVGGQFTWLLIRQNLLGPRLASGEYLTARLALDDEESRVTPAGPRFATRFGDLQTELVRRIEGQAGVSGITFSAAIHGTDPGGMMETDQLGHAPLRVRFNHVDSAFFEVFGIEVLAGRGFEAGDFESRRRVAIINRTLAEEIGPGSPLGMQVRHLAEGGELAPEPGPWHEIVGVVDDLPLIVNVPRMYHPMPPGQIHPVSLALHAGPTIPADLAGRLLQVTRALSPGLRIAQLRALDQVYRDQNLPGYIGALGLLTIVLTVILFSAAGIHTLSAFAATQRRREIGIRSALGAQPWRVVADILRRALSPVAAGALAGALLALPISRFVTNDGISIVTLCASVAIMVVIGLLAVIGPARRAVRLDPTEALREG